MSAPYERDLAHEADMRELHREQLRNDVEDEEADMRAAYRARLRADISAEEADEEWAEREANGEFDYGDEASDEELDDYYAERVKRRRRLLGKPA